MTKDSKKAKIFNILLALLIAINLLSQLAFILHLWEYSRILYFGSKICFGIIYMIKIYGDKRPNAFGIIKSVLILCWSFLDLIFMFLGLTLPFYLLNGHTFLWIWIFVLGFEGLKDSFTPENRVSNIIFILSAICIFIGALFKVLHLLESDIIIYIGLTLGVYWILTEFFGKTK